MTSRIGRIALVGGLVAATGIVAVVATQRPGLLPFTGDISPGQVRAMHDDLGLSEEQARDLLARQAEAAAAQERLSRDAHTSTAGSYFDPKTGKLTVNITDPRQADAIRDGGGEPREVDNSLAALEKATEKLAENTSPRDVAGWHIDPVSNTVVVTALPGRQESARELVEKAGVPSKEITIKEAEFPPQVVSGTPVTDLLGGNPFFTQERNSCSIGIPVVDARGTPGFTTAGHCGAPGTRISSTLSGPAWGTITESIFPGEMDGSWVKAPGGKAVARVNDYQGGSVAIAGSNEALINAAVCRFGATTKWKCGTILAKDVVVDYGTHGKVTGLTKMDTCADIGDSGGAVMSGDQAQGVTSGVEGGCAQGGNVTYYQEINQILRTWQLTIPGQKGPPGPPPTTAPPSTTPPAQSSAPVTTSRPTASTTPSTPKPTTGTSSTPKPTTPGDPPPCGDQEITGTVAAGGGDVRPARPLEAPGSLVGCLTGADGAELELFLERRTGQSWITVADGVRTGSTERISFSGEAGEYRWRIQALSGSSARGLIAYTLRTDAP